jgi:uncharacterized protein
MNPSINRAPDFAYDVNLNALIREVEPLYDMADSAHDFSHAIRVCRSAIYIGKREGADMEILILSALLHDAECDGKCSENRDISEAQPIFLSNFLDERNIAENIKDQILYSIRVHRFSKGIIPITLEAKILQDADRLDAMGAIGIARVFATGGALGRALYSPEDPFCLNREPNDSRWNVDHFFKKLLKLESGMHTQTARKLARKRAVVLKKYLLDLQAEIEVEAGEAI